MPAATNLHWMCSGKATLSRTHPTEASGSFAIETPHLHTALGNGEYNRERGALAGRALDRQRAAIALEDRATDAEAKPAAIGVCRGKRLEDRTMVLAGDAGAGIGYGENRAIARSRAADGDGAAGGHGGHRI